MITNTFSVILGTFWQRFGCFRIGKFTETCIFTYFILRRFRHIYTCKFTKSIINLQISFSVNLSSLSSFFCVNLHKIPAKCLPIDSPVILQKKNNNVDDCGVNTIFKYNLTTLISTTYLLFCTFSRHSKTFIFLIHL